MACGTVRLLPALSMQGREGDGRSSDGRGGEREEEVEDDFACVGMLRGSLMSLHGSVERIFRVSFGIGADDDAEGLPHSNNGQMWLKLRGPSSNVTEAKLFVKGVVNQEQQQEVSYPEVLHCVFCGARGLFMDCLMKTTSAHIVIGSPGCLLISGLTEPVVQAYSLITDLVERYKGIQDRTPEVGDRALGELLDSRRAFKSLVERWEDRHTLDLLVLPGSVKETLLDLVRDSGLGSISSPGDSAAGRENHRDVQGASTQGALQRLTLKDGTVRDRLGGELNERRDVGKRDFNNVERFGGFPSSSPLHSGTDTRVGGKAGGVPHTPASSTGATDHCPHPLHASSAGVRLRAGGAEDRRMGSPQEVGEEGQPEGGGGRLDVMEDRGEEDGEGELLLSVGSKKEFRLLLKFFTAMGYTEAVVRRVIARTGPKEASQILDLVQQEQDRSDREQSDPDRHRDGNREIENGNVVRKHQDDTNLPSETEHREPGDRGGISHGGNLTTINRVGEELGGKDGSPEESAVDRSLEREGRRSKREEGDGDSKKEGEEEDFVLGVLKRAAASCGYTEERVIEVYSMWPDLSTHQLLLELQKEGVKEAETSRSEAEREGPMEVDEGVLEREGRRAGTREDERGRANEASTRPLASGGNKVERKVLEDGNEKKWDPRGRLEVLGGGLPDLEPHFLPWKNGNVSVLPTSHHQRSNSHPSEIPPEIRGPPQPTYSTAADSHFSNHPKPRPKATSSPKTVPRLTHNPVSSFPSNPQTPTHPQKQQPPQVPQYVHPASHPVQLPALAGSHSPPPTRSRDVRGFPAVSSGAVVTGEQRFMEGLQLPFDLQLTDEPGNPSLRMIIIDGSNVAMSHGLGHFFSCRGIALAVQHFWKRGHRRISTFVPQWRQKRDSRVKEQHFLTALQDLGLVSYTPSREVQGKRINSYDDRFMLQLAQKTDGVIVTNDNLRDLLDESHVWRDIIKKRLLQYTFVGDHFMVPDDPLGRGGPHLDDFLLSQHRPPDPGSHSFAGTASPFPFSTARTPRSQTEVLHFRDRTQGGSATNESTAAAEVSGSRGARRGGKGRGNQSSRVGPAGHAGSNHQQHHHQPSRKQQLGSGGSGSGLSNVDRSPEETARLRESLCQVFPGQDSMVTLVLQSHPWETDINSLSYLILEQQEE